MEKRKKSKNFKEKKDETDENAEEKNQIRKKRQKQTAGNFNILLTLGSGMYKSVLCGGGAKKRNWNDICKQISEKV